MNVLTKAELISDVAERTGCVASVVKEILNATYDSMEDAILFGDGVRIGHLGTLSPKGMKARKVKSGLTGTVTELPDRIAVKYTPSKNIKESLKALSK